MTTRREIEEEFPSRLVRVIRKMRRQLPNGSVKEYEQAFRVKKAAPGDRYAMHPQSSGAPAGAVPGGPPDQQQMDPQQMDPQQDPSLAEPPPKPPRMTVFPLDIPWEIGEEEQEKDPVPAEVRKRYDPKNKAGMAFRAIVAGSLANMVEPGEQMLWGVVERELTDRLRGGRLSHFVFSGNNSGTLRVKAEGGDGYIHKALLKIESLTDPYTYRNYKRLYSVERAFGGFAKRASAAYEFSKGVGMDDLIPPTVVRKDDYGPMDQILSSDLLERRDYFSESIARVTGEPAEKLKKRMSGFSSVVFCPDGIQLIDKEKWFVSVFQRGSSGEQDQKDVLNRIFEIMPKDRRTAILRVAMLDYLLWTGDRPLAGLAFTRDPRHPVVMLDNELSFADPRQIALEYSKSQGEYIGDPIDPDAFPLLWSDPLLLLAVRGQEKELADFENIGTEVYNRMKGERSIEVARGMIDHQINHVSIAAALFRVYLLLKYSKQIARDPYIVAACYAAMATGAVGSLLDECQHEVAQVNWAMSKAAGGNFDMIAEMQKA